MSSTAFEHGESVQKQFRRVIVAGGPLQGARYLDVGWDDLRKAARSYRGDARFNQFAKRVLSERALGNPNDNSSSSKPATAVGWKDFFINKLKVWFNWIMSKAKMKMGITAALFVLVIILLSRPLFYTVLAKSLALSIRVLLRRSVGFVVMIMDALLDEAASSLETYLLTPPGMHEPPQMAPHMPPPYDLTTAPRTLREILWHGLFTVLVVLIGHRLPRAVRYDRNNPPTRLRVV